MWWWGKLDWIVNKLHEHELRIRLLETQRKTEMADFTKLQADVTAQNTVVASVQTLLTNLSAAIAALKAGNPADQAAIDALAAQVEANSAALASAVTSNTPSA
jgi:hypothetical protein